VWRNPGRRPDSAPIRLIVGLGNPGRRYRGTFHNAGFAVVDHLAGALGIRLRSSGGIESGSGTVDGTMVLLAKPMTYMNRSGEAVAPLYRRREASSEDLIVIHDDLDIPLGRVRLKRGGGMGGHKGLLSLQDALGTRDFLRVRVGIGRPPEGEDPADYVLSPVPAESRDLFLEGVASAGEAVRGILTEGFDRAATRWNARRTDPPPQGTEGDILLAPGETGGSIIRKEDCKTDGDKTV
jgi:peptidyl-tRNA hydrolase, PTH1 family